MKQKTKSINPGFSEILYFIHVFGRFYPSEFFWAVQEAF